MRLFVKNIFYLIIFTCLISCSNIGLSSFNKESIFIEPESGRRPWVDAIFSAKKTIYMSAYKLSDPIIIGSLKEANKRGVKIALLIEPFSFEHSNSSNIKSPIEELTKIASIYTLSERFDQAHGKFLIVDKEFALISTGNLDSESFDGVAKAGIPAARDFIVSICNKKNIDEIYRIFISDINDKRFVPAKSDIVVGPDYQRSTFLKLINGSIRKIDFYQQSCQDDGIVRALAGAARNGVEVRCVMTPYPFSKKEDKNITNQNFLRKSGAKVGLLESPYIHAKVLIADDKEMYVGSGNFYANSIDQTRELGILIKNPKQIKVVKDQFEKDWRKSTLITKDR